MSEREQGGGRENKGEIGGREGEKEKREKRGIDR
jgi:hypothetical protein